MLIFFDQSFVDCSFSTRFYRQKKQAINFARDILKIISAKKLDLDLKIGKLKRARQIADPRFNSQYSLTHRVVNLSSEKKDPTLDQYISDKGFIKSHVDNSIHLTKRSYQEHLKQTNHHLHD